MNLPTTMTIAGLITAAASLPALASPYQITASEIQIATTDASNGVYRIRGVATPAAHQRMALAGGAEYSIETGMLRIAAASAPPAGCAGDLDGDGDTDVYDFSMFAAGFGMASGATPADGDLDGSGSVDVLDFAILSGDFGCSE